MITALLVYRASISFLLLLPLCISGQSNSLSMTPLPQTINTRDNEEFGRWSVDGKSIIFNRWKQTATEHVNAFFIASFDTAGALIGVARFHNDTLYNGGGFAISPDGKQFVFTSCQRYGTPGNCDLYRSQLIDGHWSKSVNMGTAVNGPNWEGHPIFGIDGRTLYFASNRPGGYGRSDIWMSREIEPGKWSNAVNVGSGINTADMEGTPFVHFDGQTLYFMRDGNKGFGGYDLYFAQLDDNGQWQTAKNMGLQINSASDEGGLVLHPDGKTVLITREMQPRQNDLFQFELPVEWRSSPVQALTINFKDAVSGKPMRAQLDLFEINGSDSIRTSNVADEFGNVIMTLQQNKAYGFVASAPGYSMHSSNLVANREPDRKLVVSLRPMTNASAQAMTLENIFFETGSYTLLPSSIPELTILIRILQRDPEMKIEIRGHTDNVGLEEANQVLSETRAKTVYQYLIDHGIAANRLSFKGLGEKQPKATNETEAGRKKNRRTEFVIK
jgi:outer membrane protein OmpA-like peptidoglycan-associated protein